MLLSMTCTVLVRLLQLQNNGQMLCMPQLPDDRVMLPHHCSTSRRSILTRSRTSYMQMHAATTLHVSAHTYDIALASRGCAYSLHHMLQHPIQLLASSVYLLLTTCHPLLVQVDNGTWFAPDILAGSSPGARAFHSAVAVGSRVLVFGGHMLSFDQEHNKKRRNFFSDIWQLDTVSTYNTSGNQLRQQQVQTETCLLLWECTDRLLAASP